jgi:hypothetical protein
MGKPQALRRFPGPWCTPGQVPGPAWEFGQFGGSVALEPVALVPLAPFISAISAAAAAAVAAAVAAAAAACRANIHAVCGGEPMSWCTRSRPLGTAESETQTRSRRLLTRGRSGRDCDFTSRSNLTPSHRARHKGVVDVVELGELVGLAAVTSVLRKGSAPRLQGCVPIDHVLGT